MKEKYIFLIGLGMGLVIASIIGLFSHNMSIPNNINVETESSSNEDIDNEGIDATTESTTLLNITETTTNSMEIITSKPMEITTSKPMEITTENSFELSTN